MYLIAQHDFFEEYIELYIAVFEFFVIVNLEKVKMHVIEYTATNQ